MHDKTTFENGFPPVDDLRRSEREYADCMAQCQDAQRLEAAAYRKDGILACILLAMAWPLLGLLALLIRLDSPGAIIFKQKRVGRYGKVFTIYKFRTMRAHDGNNYGGKQAVAGDARITRIGRLLRRSGLDELPQLWNVIRGEMALIGPRPHAVEHDLYFAQHIADYWLRYTVKPGLTGWAQIKGCRGATPTIAVMQERVGYDIDYVHRRNPLLDGRILAATVKTVLTPPSLLH